MIVVYTGKMNIYSVGMIAFQKGIPSFVPPRLRKEITESEDFEIYDPAKDYISDEKPAILIQLPFEFINFLAAIPTVQRIKESFPLCPLQLIYPDEWIGLMNYGTQIKFYDQSKRFYRAFDLSIQNNQQLYMDYHKRLFPYHLLIMQFIQMFDLANDRALPPPQIEWNKKPTVKPYILIFTKASSGPVFSGLAEYLSENLELDLEIRFCEDTKPKNIQEQIDLINNATYCIFTGYNELAYLTGALRIPAFGFFMPDNPTRLEKQHEVFPDFLWSHIEYHDGETLFPKIVSKLEALIKPFINGVPKNVKESTSENDSTELESKKKKQIK